MGETNYQPVSENIINGASINTEATSSTVKCQGYSSVSFFIDYTYSAGTNVQLRVDQSLDGTNWFQTPMGDSSTPPTYTIAEMVISRAAGAANFKTVTRPVPINASFLRCRVIATGVPDAGDIVSVTSRLSTDGGGSLGT